MKKRNVLKVALICGGVAALGYLVKKAHDINEELNNLKLDDLTEDLFESDIPKTPTEEKIFARHAEYSAPDSTEVENAEEKLEETEEEVVLDEEEVCETADEVAEEAIKEAESEFTETELAENEGENIPEEVPIPPEVYNKIGKLEDLLTFEGLDFDTNQRDYLYHIIDYMRTHHEMRLALLIGMDYNGKHPLEVFTDVQFAEIKKIIQ